MDAAWCAARSASWPSGVTAQHLAIAPECRRTACMPKDGLARLPDHIVAPLLRALMHIRHTPHSRLLLQHPTNGRAPSWDQSLDFDVVGRREKVGRIWRHAYVREVFEEYPWHWDISTSR